MNAELLIAHLQWGGCHCDRGPRPLVEAPGWERPPQGCSHVTILYFFESHAHETQ